MKKTYFADNNFEHQWHLVDATDQTLGRMATQIAMHLRGKHRPEYTPHADAGDYVIVINAEKVKVTGKKKQDKMYYSHSGYSGGIKEISFENLQKKNPEKIIELAVKGMLPKNPLGRAMFRKLKVYHGSEHPHTAQQPNELNFTEEKNRN